PVFKKAMGDNQNGHYISEELAKIQRNKYKYYSDYANDFNLELNKYIKHCYDKIEPLEGLGLLFFVDNYYFILLEAEDYTILLNYDKKVENNMLQLIPHVSKYEVHVKEYEQNNKMYKVTNTYFSFLNYTDFNFFPQTIESNEPFYDSFFNSIKNEDLEIDLGKLRTIEDSNSMSTDKFKYIVIEDEVFKEKSMIIIVDYITNPFFIISDDDIPF
ncbi:MAG: hypothetical protein K0Q97_3125, partial [Bacillota bacterium]|nr:hypothetical protein [Bacillota bacterium]